ncbi:hypothetical protein [Ramlibacter sp.]|uniref:hypothetical protein n=1 Tax=Ramlibacter sp. TaxID=1917967 RepID=UPI002D2DF5BB|nr:hypothetical protein [Ramlibacter sp.]HYD74505.1 hypothetical protein [Ramlibacter sp.]
MPSLDDVDVLREVERGRVPAHVARRPRLVALREQALAMVREQALVRARASWRVVPLEGEPGTAGWLCLDGHRLQAPWLVPGSGQLTGVACAVATLGEGLERKVSELFAERRAALAVALDGLGNELLFALSRKVQDRMLAGVRKQGLGMAGELRAGDPGLALSAQQVVLQLAGAGDIGVELTRTLMMHPAKSTSIVQGVGLALPAQTWSRCDACPSRPRCVLALEAA